MPYSGLTELVFVSHVIDPCHFYIRRYSQRKEALALQKKLENFCCNKNSYLLPSDILELGARTFIKSKETGMWCRGTITELIPLESKSRRKPRDPIRYRVYDVALLKVFLVDFGSSIVLVFSGYGPSKRPDPAALQTIETHDICLFVRKPDRHIEAQLAAVPSLAVRCSLKDIVPKNASEGWGEEAKRKFVEMVNNKVVSMIVFGKENDVLIVDLRKPSFVEISSDIPVSLRDTLVFLDLARLQAPSQLEKNTVLRYNPPDIPQEGEEVFVVVSHINSPSDFYLWLRESLESLSLQKKIQEVYKHENEENLGIFCPVEGQACIAKQEDGNWYRAQIRGLPSCQEVTVKYVDYGNTANISHKDIRRVKEEFLSFPEKAIRCRLACIEPFKGADEWNREAKKRFEEMTEDKLMLCLVIEIVDNVLSVELFHSPVDNRRKLSVNCQLVEEDLASYIPGYTKNTVVESNEIWDEPLEEIPKTSEVDEGDCRLLSKQEMRGRISHVVSPSKIFLRLLSSEIILKSLQEEMASIYKESQPQPVKWESSMHCAVYVPDVGQWQRGQISRIISETSAEVILYDSGVEKTVEISCLRELEENMKAISTLAIECWLTDIRTDKADMVCSVSKEYLNVHLEEENTQVDVCNSKTACARNRAVPEENIAVSESEQKSFKTDKSLPHSGMDETYTSPVIPEAKFFLAVVSCVGGDGTIYIIPKSYENALSKLMTEIQSAFKGLGLLMPYGWKKGEACVVRGSDTRWYRGKVVEVNGSTLQVQYIDHGYTESIPQCHLYPTTLYTDIPPFCIPCQLYKTLPKPGLLEGCGVHLSERKSILGHKLVNPGEGSQVSRRAPEEHHLLEQVQRRTRKMIRGLEEKLYFESGEELPNNPWDKLSISLYFGGISLSSFMAQQKYCIAEDCLDMQKLGLSAGDIPVSPWYVLPPLPVPGDTFPVRVTHLVSPKEVCLRNISHMLQSPGADEKDIMDNNFRALEMLQNGTELIDAELPCLAEYVDGLWYRAKLLSVTESDPVQILIQFVDYGTYSVAPMHRLRYIPYCLLKYPVQAVRVLLAGFKPASDDKNTDRIPYSPEWSLQALWAMANCVEGKHLSASMLTLSPEVTISLYGDDKTLVHLKLIEMGLAELDE
ncbi:RING finger protein 17 [Willisornis vidua]|uniref:RING finger protein 17 n=1 Tax=Willisornis vidua TaxID=1566151 RepID=A0ABQ9DW17_9PASS|nr:RING finger protein 17 [Willisornis vidua]